MSWTNIIHTNLHTNDDITVVCIVVRMSRAQEQKNVDHIIYLIITYSQAIKKFRTGECNVIICSNVLEEGIDIQACNYVFTVDPLKTFNSYIQTKGRARSFDSFYSVIAPLCDRKKIALQIKKYRDAHEEIKSFLIGRVLDREDPNQDEIAEQFTDDFEPFVIKSGARLMASSALNILHRYCQSLPSDVYGIPGPSFSIAARTEENDFVIALQLPIQSTVKETVMVCKQNAGTNSSQLTTLNLFRIE